MLVHGDDFVAVGDDAGFADVRSRLADEYISKVEVLGDAPGCVGEFRILNKVVRHTKSGIELEVDPRHAEIAVRELGLENAKHSKTPGVKEVIKKDSDDDCDGRDRLGIGVVQEEEEE